jgi:hypothetical protein
MEYPRLSHDFLPLKPLSHAEVAGSIFISISALSVAFSVSAVNLPQAIPVALYRNPFPTIRS